MCSASVLLCWLVQVALPHVRACVTVGAVARAAGEHEQVLVDGNKEAEGLAHCDIIEVQPSPDHTILAYAVDTTVSAGDSGVACCSGCAALALVVDPGVLVAGLQGDEVYTIKFLDLATCKLLADELTNHSCGFTWGKDSTELFYLTLDDAHRPCVGPARSLAYAACGAVPTLFSPSSWLAETRPFGT